MWPNLQMNTLTVAYNVKPPYIVRRGNLTSGWEYQTLLAMAQYMNFTFELVNCNGISGVKTNGTWNGISRMIVTGEADIGMGGIMVTYERHQDMQFLGSYWIDQLSYGTSWPHHHPGFEQFGRPFHWSVWLALLGSFLWFHLLDRLHHQWQPHRHRCRRASFLWVMVQLLFRQNYRQMRHASHSQRLLLLVWVLAAWILTTFYSAFLCAMLAVPNRATIDSVKELNEACRRQRITPLCLPGGTRHTYFRAFQSIFEQLELVPNDEESLRIMLAADGHRQYAMLAMRNTLAYLQAIRGPDSFYLPPENDGTTFTQFNNGILVDKAFPYKDHFSRFVFRMGSTGIFLHWFQSEIWSAKKVWRTRNSRQPHEHDPDQEDDEESEETHHHDYHFNEFDLSHLASVFYIYLIGVGFSVLCLSIEFVLFRHPP